MIFNSTKIFVRKKFAKKKLKNPVLIVGLPGIGLIGQIVVRHLIKKLKAKPYAVIISPHFPYQVVMLKNGRMRMIRNTIYLGKIKRRDVLFLIGDVQAVTIQGQYEVNSTILDFAKRKGVKEIITIGGYATRKMENNKVFGVANCDEIIKKFEKHGVVFGEARGTIVGSAGLLPGLGRYYKLRGISLLAATHGNYVDVKAAERVLKILFSYFNFEVDMKELEKRAKKDEKLIKKIEKELRRQLVPPQPQPPTDLSYIR